MADSTQDERSEDPGARDVAEMESRSQELKEQIEAVDADWQRKRADSHVPGANPPPGEEAEPAPGELPVPENPAAAHSQDDQHRAGQ
jgi:hypothetical protein